MIPTPQPSEWEHRCRLCLSGPMRIPSKNYTGQCSECKKTAIWGHEWGAVAWMAAARRTMRDGMGVGWWDMAPEHLGFLILPMFTTPAQELDR